jgi:hypothetical protein
MDALPDSSGGGCTDFAKITCGFLSHKGLPFADILSSDRIERVFAKHENLFAIDGIYSTAVVVWAFLGQVLRDGKEASCQSAVAYVISYCLQLGNPAPTSDTGDYCRARAKLSEHAIHHLSNDVASEMEQAAPLNWMWKSLHPKLIDGFTFTMPDTAENQHEYPQHKAQKPGLGQPIARVATVLSLATACVLDAAIGPYQGKQTGENALLRTILHSFDKDDVAVADRYYCSFMMIALMLSQGTQVCARKHQLRHTDFRRGKRLGKNDHIIAWKKPPRPAWMDRETYQEITPTLLLRELRYQVIEKGRRTRTLTIITTLLDPEQYTLEDIAQLYGFRWNVELDIRSIKESLNLGHVRCKSPEMVRREFWMTLLAYNLIRTTAAGAALLHDKQPRQVSFTATCQYVLASWMSMATGSVKDPAMQQYIEELLSRIIQCEVAHRPGRLEPRVVKRRPKPYKLMRKPRHVLKRQLRKSCT